MSKKTLIVDCPECLNHCVLQGTHVDSATFCPFCGENLMMVVDDIDDDNDLIDDIDDDIEYDE